MDQGIPTSIIPKSNKPIIVVGVNIQIEATEVRTPSLRQERGTKSRAVVGSGMDKVHDSNEGVCCCEKVHIPVICVLPYHFLRPCQCSGHVLWVCILDIPGVRPDRSIPQVQRLLNNPINTGLDLPAAPNVH